MEDARNIEDLVWGNLIGVNLREHSISNRDVRVLIMIIRTLRDALLKSKTLNKEMLIELKMVLRYFDSLGLQGQPLDNHELLESILRIIRKSVN